MPWRPTPSGGGGGGGFNIPGFGGGGAPGGGGGQQAPNIMAAFNAMKQQQQPMQGGRPQMPNPMQSGQNPMSLRNMAGGGMPQGGRPQMGQQPMQGGGMPRPQMGQQQQKYQSAHPMLSPSPGVFNQMGKGLTPLKNMAGGGQQQQQMMQNPQGARPQMGQQQQQGPIIQETDLDLARQDINKQLPEHLQQKVKVGIDGPVSPGEGSMAQPVKFLPAAGQKVYGQISGNDKLLDKYGINTPQRKAHFFGQLAHETGGFRWLNELGAESYFNKYEPGTRIGRRLGNTEAGDGARFKGRGLIHLTGRDNYKRYGGLIGQDLVKNPQKAAEPGTALHLALEYWKQKGLNKFADQGNLKEITRRINGGFNGLRDREKYVNHFLRAL